MLVKSAATLSLAIMIAVQTSVSAKSTHACSGHPPWAGVTKTPHHPPGGGGRTNHNHNHNHHHGYDNPPGLRDCSNSMPQPTCSDHVTVDSEPSATKSPVAPPSVAPTKPPPPSIVPPSLPGVLVPPPEPGLPPPRPGMPGIAQPVVSTRTATPTISRTMTPPHAYPTPDDVDVLDEHHLVSQSPHVGPPPTPTITVAPPTSPDACTNKVADSDDDDVLDEHHLVSQSPRHVGPPPGTPTITVAPPSPDACTKKAEDSDDDDGLPALFPLSMLDEAFSLSSASDLSHCQRTCRDPLVDRSNGKLATSGVVSTPTNEGETLKQKDTAVEKKHTTVDKDATTKQKDATVKQKGKVKKIEKLFRRLTHTASKARTKLTHSLKASQNRLRRSLKRLKTVVSRAKALPKRWLKTSNPTAATATPFKVNRTRGEETMSVTPTTCRAPSGESPDPTPTPSLRISQSRTVSPDQNAATSSFKASRTSSDGPMSVTPTICRPPLGESPHPTLTPSPQSRTISPGQHAAMKQRDLTGVVCNMSAPVKCNVVWSDRAVARIEAQLGFEDAIRPWASYVVQAELQNYGKPEAVNHAANAVKTVAESINKRSGTRQSKPSTPTQKSSAKAERARAKLMKQQPVGRRSNNKAPSAKTAAPKKKVSLKRASAPKKSPPNTMKRHSIPTTMKRTKSTLSRRYVTECMPALAALFASVIFFAAVYLFIEANAKLCTAHAAYALDHEGTEMEEIRRAPGLQQQADPPSPSDHENETPHEGVVAQRVSPADAEPTRIDNDGGEAPKQASLEDPVALTTPTTGHSTVLGKSPLVAADVEDADADEVAGVRTLNEADAARLVFPDPESSVVMDESSGDDGDDGDGSEGLDVIGDEDHYDVLQHPETPDRKTSPEVVSSGTDVATPSPRRSVPHDDHDPASMHDDFDLCHE